MKPVIPAAGGRPAQYDLGELVRGYIAWKLGATETPRDRRDRSQAEWTEIRIQKERRLLIPREQAVQEGAMFVKAAAAKLRALPSRMVRAGLIPTETAPAVAELVAEAQREIARWSTAERLAVAVEEEPE